MPHDIPELDDDVLPANDSNETESLQVQERAPYEEGNEGPATTMTLPRVSREINCLRTFNKVPNKELTERLVDLGGVMRRCLFGLGS